MTHSTASLEPVSYGSQEAVLHQINITSLDSAGQEDYEPWNEVNIPNGSRLGVAPVAQTNNTVRFSWDPDNDHLDVINVGDASNVANNGDPGEVKLLVVGGGT